MDELIGICARYLTYHMYDRNTHFCISNLMGKTNEGFTDEV